MALLARDIGGLVRFLQCPDMIVILFYNSCYHDKAMEKQHLIIICTVVVAVVLVAAGVAILMNNGEGGSSGITVTDARDRTVHLEKTPEEILAVNCCSLELLSYFDAVNKVVAIDKDDALTNDKTYTLAYKAQFSKLNTIDRTNVESIIVLNPDVIITSTVAVEELDKLQKDTGIPVFAINADLEFGDEKWFTQLTSLGKLVGEEKRADTLVNGIKGLIDEIKAKSVSKINGYTCGMMFYGQGTFLKTSGDWLPFIYSGVNNVMPPSTSGAGKQPYNTDIETVMSKDIDYIFIDNSRASAVVEEMQGYISEAGLINDAITNGEIYNVCLYKKWGTQFDNVLINCFYVAKTVNPDGYSWSFEEKADAVLKLFYGDGKITYSDMKAAGNGCGKITL